MKNYLKIGIVILVLTSCSTTKRAEPCRQCPHYSELNKNRIKWEQEV